MLIQSSNPLNASALTFPALECFHIIGLADFLLAVGTGLALTLVGTPLMSNIAAYPVVLIPLLGVPVSGAMHVMALDIAWNQFRRKY